MNKSKRNLIIGSSVIAIIIFFVIRAVSLKQFEKNMDELKIQSGIALMSAEFATSQYADIWRKRIESRSSYMYYDGKDRYFADFSEAVDYVVTACKNTGLLSKMDINLSIANDELKKVENSLFGDRRAKDAARSLYLNISEYCSLANNPTGSLQSFNNKRHELSTTIDRDKREIDLYVK